MALRTFKCMNVGNGCSNADTGKTFELADLGNPTCPVCATTTIIPVKQGRALPPLAVAALILVAVAGVSGVGYYFWSGRSHSVPPAKDMSATTMSARPEDTLKQPSGTLSPSPAATGDAGMPCGLKAVSQPDVNRLLVYLKQGMIYATQKRYDLALNEFEQVRQIDPNFLAMHENVAAAELKMGRLSESEKHLQEELKLVGCLDQMSETDLSKFAYMLEVGQEGASNPTLARAQAMRKRIKQARAAAHYNLACIRSHEGVTEQAITELRQAVESGFSDVSALRRDPDLATVRSTRGFQEVLDSASAKRQAP